MTLLFWIGVAVGWLLAGLPVGMVVGAVIRNGDRPADAGRVEYLTKGEFRWPDVGARAECARRAIATSAGGGGRTCG